MVTKTKEAYHYPSNVWFWAWSKVGTYIEKITLVKAKALSPGKKGNTAKSLPVLSSQGELYPNPL